MIRFLQVYLNHCKVAQDLLMQMEKEQKTTISLVSEPYRVPNNANWVACTNGTAAIHWNGENSPFTGILMKQGRFSVAMRWGTMIVIFCYISPNVNDNVYEEFLDELDDCLLDLDQNSEFVLGGDFNSKSPLWGCPYSDSRGDRLSRWCASKDIVLINEGNQPTCIRHQGTSIVDITWCSAKIKFYIV